MKSSTAILPIESSILVATSWRSRDLRFCVACTSGKNLRAGVERPSCQRPPGKSMALSPARFAIRRSDQ